MEQNELSKAVRKFLDFAVVTWASVIFVGSALGCVFLLLWKMFLPGIQRAIPSTIDPNVPDWAFFGVGIAIVLFFRTLRGKPLMKDSSREELDTIEYLVERLPKEEQTAAYRALVKKMIEQYSDKGRRTVKSKVTEDRQKTADAKVDSDLHQTSVDKLVPSHFAPDVTIGDPMNVAELIKQFMVEKSEESLKKSETEKKLGLSGESAGESPQPHSTAYPAREGLLPSDEGT